MGYQKILKRTAYVLSFFLLAGQLGLIGVYFIKYISTEWLNWYYFGAFVLIHWSFITYKHIKPSTVPNLCDKVSQCYVGWLVYWSNLTSSLIILFYVVTNQLEEKFFLGPRMLKLVLGFTPFLFVTFVYAHYNRDSFLSPNYFLEYLASEVTLDLFDGFEILENLFANDLGTPVSAVMKVAIIILTSINFLLPAFALYDLHTPSSNRVAFRVYYKLFSFGLNISYLILRILLWSNYNKDISVLFMKNIIMIILHFEKLLYRFYGQVSQTLV